MSYWSWRIATSTLCAHFRASVLRSNVFEVNRLPRRRTRARNRSVPLAEILRSMVAIRPTPTEGMPPSDRGEPADSPESWSARFCGELLQGFRSAFESRTRKNRTAGALRSAVSQPCPTTSWYQQGRGTNPLFQLENSGGQGRNRTTDTRIFSPLLYQLSYLAAAGIIAAPAPRPDRHAARKPSSSASVASGNSSAR